MEGHRPSNNELFIYLLRSGESGVELLHDGLLDSFHVCARLEAALDELCAAASLARVLVERVLHHLTNVDLGLRGRSEDEEDWGCSARGSVSVHGEQANNRAGLHGEDLLGDALEARDVSVVYLGAANVVLSLDVLSALEDFRGEVLGDDLVVLGESLAISNDLGLISIQS
eukprot:GEZU01012187.1.p1 GENE.GEZU01012187.1~~GEZU01012187.1.p1  ORF type:complete len:171 (-),score=26.78 GEZU01012187.1:123-635(-)